MCADYYLVGYLHQIIAMIMERCDEENRPNQSVTLAPARCPVFSKMTKKAQRSDLQMGALFSLGSVFVLGIFS
jgi:hypothetical protein